MFETLKAHQKNGIRFCMVSESGYALFLIKEDGTSDIMINNRIKNLEKGKTYTIEELLEISKNEKNL